MSKEVGVVSKIKNDIAWVKTTRTKACEHCGQKKQCGSIGGSGDEVEVETLNEIGAKVGDNVEINLETSSMLQLTFIVYIFPIILMLIGAIIGNNLAIYLNISQSAASAIFGFGFLIISFLIVKKIEGKIKNNSKYRPVIVKIK